jgi:hypothetical protein
MYNFYFESYEVFVRESPIVLSYRPNIKKENSVSLINNSTLNFFVGYKLDFERENFLDYFHVQTDMAFDTNNRKSM